MTTDLSPLPSLPRRSDVIARHRANGGHVAAVLPVHPPRALLHAHGILPVEVWGPPGQDTTSADVHLQAYTCSVVRAGLAWLQSEPGADADLLVVPHTCDSLQGLGSLLLDLLPPGRPVIPFYLPRGEGEATQRFLAAELRAVSKKLCDAFGTTPDDEAVMAAVLADVEADRRVRALLQRRGTLGASAREFLGFLRSREYLPPDEFVALADVLLARPPSTPPSGPRLLLSGMLPEPAELLDRIEAAGGVIVADDLACGGRRAYPDGRATDPFERMAERLLEGPPGPTRGVSVQSRVEHLAATAEASKAQIVLFWGVKFCEPELFYLPQLRADLERRGLRTLAIETDVSDALPHQVITRVEALLETTP